MTEADQGHRLVAHPADLRVEAWGATREECIAQAVRAMVKSFAGDSLPEPVQTVEYEVTGGSDADLLAAALDEVIYRLETTGHLPARTEVSATRGGLRLRFGMVDADDLDTIGAVPKAVSLHGLRCAWDGRQWRCSATIDV